MVREDEDALICDFAETYHIYNWRDLPLTTAAVLARGLGSNSRIVQKAAGQNASNGEILLAAIADRLGILLAGLSNTDAPPLFSEAFFDMPKQTKKNNIQKFSSPEEFLIARRKAIHGIGGETNNGN